MNVPIACRYFPVYAAFGMSGSKHAQVYKKEFPEFKWAQFLNLRYNLLWIGGGSSSGGPVSRLHFDRNENLMTMVLLLAYRNGFVVCVLP